MKIALVCLAKNEDFYIDEWIKYHTKLGFDHIYIYQHDWRYSGVKSFYKNTTWFQFDVPGINCQMEAFQNFLVCQNKNKYDFVAYFDVDEYLSLPNHQNVKDFLINYNDVYSIGINWRLFGNNNLSFNGNYSLVNRFTKCQKAFNKHVKLIINLKKIYNLTSLRFQTPHNLELSNKMDITINVDKTAYIHGPFNDCISTHPNAYLNHYYCKTIEEYNDIKLARAKEYQNYGGIDKYNEHNFNEIEDFTAKNFFNT